MSRRDSAFLGGGLIVLVSTLVVFYFTELFALVITVTTRYAQPLLGLMLCLFAGWIWHRNQVLEEIKAGFEQVEHAIIEPGVREVARLLKQTGGMEKR